MLYLGIAQHARQITISLRGRRQAFIARDR